MDGYNFYLIMFFVGIIGLCIGSFLNVVILRAFSNESIVLPPSKCPKCGEKLKPYDNIPILSYLMLRGKCRKCECKISLQYPIVEAVTSLAFMGAFFAFGLGLKFLFVCIFLSLFIVLAVTDLKEQVIFDWHTYILAGFGILYNAISLPAFTPFQSLKFAFMPAWCNIPVVSAILGLVIGVVAMELFARSSLLVIGKRAFGEGDSYIAGALGAVYGWQNVLVIIVLSFAIQGILVLPMFVKKLWLKKEYTQIYAIALFIGSVLLFKACDWLGLMHNFAVFVAAFLQMILFGFYSCKKVLEGARNSESLTSVPFGPALVFAATILTFWYR